MSGNELTCNTSENTQPQTAQLAEPLWTDHGLKSGINVYELISTKKKKREKKEEENSTGWEWMVKHSPQILPSKEKATTNNKGL